MKRVRLKPSVNGGDGRDPATGRFVKGWRGGPGNPFASRVNDLRNEMIAEASSGKPTRLRKVVKKLFDRAESGDVAAGKLVLERLFGKPAQQLYLEVDPTMEGYDPDERYL